MVTDGSLVDLVQNSGDVSSFLETWPGWHMLQQVQALRNDNSDIEKLDIKTITSLALNLAK